jgi:hypothetical protein
MPLSCVVGGCTRNAEKNRDVFWLSFPRDPATRRQWIRFVDTTRSDFSLSEYSKVCSAHFSEECVDETYKLKICLGLQARFKLKEGSVPTLKSPTLSRLVATSSAAATTSTTGQTPDGHDLANSAAGPSHTTTARRSGGAFHKREKARVSMYINIIGLTRFDNWGNRFWGRLFER